MTITEYNDDLSPEEQKICVLLMHTINKCLPQAEAKLWHGHPVWFLNGNPIVGYSKRKDAVQLLFWSGQSFTEATLQPTGSFKAAEARYTNVAEVNSALLKDWLEEASKIQWDYKNIVKRKGKPERLT